MSVLQDGDGCDAGGGGVVCSTGLVIRRITRRLALAEPAERPGEASLDTRKSKQKSALQPDRAELETGKNLEKPGKTRVREATIVIYPRAELVTIRRERAPGRPLGGGIRGDIQDWSKASERRFRRDVATLELEALAVFCTLTYPASCPPTPAESKRHLEKFTKRVLRRWPSFGAVWVREFTKRGIAHFHLLAFGLPVDSEGRGLAELRRDVASLWAASVGIQNVEVRSKHERAGTEVDLLRSERGARNYLASYFKVKGPSGAKSYQRQTTYPAGRWHGKVGRRNLPVDSPETYALKEAEAVQLMRWARHLTGSRRHGQSSAHVISQNPAQWVKAAKLVQSGQ